MAKTATSNFTIDDLPAGRYAVGVSGGADSVALLSMLRRRSDLHLVVAHLDHQLRDDASTADAVFVADLAKQWNLPCVIATRSEIEPTLANPPPNASAKYRACRLAMFKRVVAEHQLAGVILAHHADDQAETVFQRLLRGSSAAGLAGMSPRTELAGLTIFRPLLRLRHADLVDHLRRELLAWREDASNTSDDYLRNRLRKLLIAAPSLANALTDLATACTDLRDWTSQTAPTLAETFSVAELADLPEPLARESARRWLVDRGAPVDQAGSAAAARLIAMASDAATPSRQDFPGSLAVRRSRGAISVAR